MMRAAEPRGELRRQAFTRGICPICSQDIPLVADRTEYNALVKLIAGWLRHIDRLDEIPSARVGMPAHNPLWDASFAIEREFTSEGEPDE